MVRHCLAPKLTLEISLGSEEDCRRSGFTNLTYAVDLHDACRKADVKLGVKWLKAPTRPPCLATMETPPESLIFWCFLESLQEATHFPPRTSPPRVFKRMVLTTSLHWNLCWCLTFTRHRGPPQPPRAPPCLPKQMGFSLG